MIQKKVCMLGAFAVGKTSLVSRFVKSIYSDKYHTTIGVKVDKKVVAVENQELNLLIWDIQGDDEFQKLRSSYLRGASGYLLVVDATRRGTLDQALLIQKTAEEASGPVPFVLAINKVDLIDQWDIDDATLDVLMERSWRVIRTSAKTGTGVEEAFLRLAQEMLRRET